MSKSRNFPGSGYENPYSSGLVGGSHPTFTGSITPASHASPAGTSNLEATALARSVQISLQNSIHGICFSPYVDGQGPGTSIDAAQIRSRLKIVSSHTRWIRSFSCTEGNELIPVVAREFGLKTLVGAWLGNDRDINEREIESVIAVARAGHADLVAVGNEVLLREDLTEDELLAYLHRVKAALPNIPVGYVDAYYLFEKHPRITAACDIVLTNCYPFWEGVPLEQAIIHMQQMYQRTVTAAGGKRVIISETGWPNQGTAFRGSIPSESGAMRYFVDTMNWAQHDNIEVFYFSAFDEAWKVGAEGDVGAYWGIWDKHGILKYAV